MIPRWWSSAALGKPVVPDVYWICAASPGATSGSRSVGEPVAQKSSQPVKRRDSRSPGSSERTSASDRSMGLPRNSGMRKTPADPDCSST